jgi:predicted MFS family arabinose efflux permease
VWPLLLASSMSQSGLDIFQIYLPVYGIQNGLSASEIGVVLAFAAVGGFAARIMLTRMIAWSNEETVLAYALLIGGVGVAAVPLFHSTVLLAFIALVFGFGINCTQPITISLLYMRSPGGRSGEALGLRFTTDNAARLAVPGIFGVLATALGLGAVFWICALLLGGGGWLCLRDAVKKDHHPNEV